MISNQQRENLKKLVRFLEALPEDYDGVRMDRWAEDGMEAANATPEHPCGTPACLAGHGPGAGIPFISSEFGRFGSPLWERYTRRVFAREQDRRAFMMGVYWPDSIPEGIARIKLVLADKVPADWDYSDRFAGEEQ